MATRTGLDFEAGRSTCWHVCADRYELNRPCRTPRAMNLSTRKRPSFSLSRTEITTIREYMYIPRGRVTSNVVDADVDDERDSRRDHSSHERSTLNEAFREGYSFLARHDDAGKCMTRSKESNEGLSRCVKSVNYKWRKMKIYCGNVENFWRGKMRERGHRNNP